MDKSCANHPESMALATCKACEKSICLMCVVDEKEGTFCSSECHSAFANGEHVPKFVAAAATGVVDGGAGVQKIDSIFDEEPAAPQAQLEEVQAPPSDEPMPIVAEGTKWRPIGNQCENHSDTPAVANCDRCGKSVCALCLLEAAQGTFCSSDCMSAGSKQPATQPARAERAALEGKPVFKFKNTPPPRQAPKSVVIAAVVILVAVGAAGGYYGWNGFTIHDPPPANPNPIVDPTPVAVNPNPIKPPDPVKPPDIKPPDPVKPPDVKPPDPAPVYYTPRVKTPKLVANQLRALNPWADTEPGSWYRLRSVRGSQVTYTDIGLKEKGKEHFVLFNQTATNGEAAPVSESRTQVPTVYLRGEESFTYEGQNFLCEIRSPGLDENSPRSWALLAGKNKGAIVKSTSPEGSFTASRVWEHTIRVKGSPLDCLVLEGQVQNGSLTRSVKIWYSGMIPVGVVQKEADGESLSLVDLGTDWTKRPAFPK